MLDFVSETFPEYGLRPVLVRRESTGFIFNGIWAAIKREALDVVAGGVCMPHDVDEMWKLMFGTEIGPFRAMDQVGLDVVYDIEEHYAAENPTLPAGSRNLLRHYLDAGKLGVKTGEGFMPITPNPNRRTDRPAGPALSLEPPGGMPARQHRTGTPHPRRDKGTAPPRCRPISLPQGDAVRTFRRLCVAPADAWSSPTEKVSHGGQQHGRHDRDQKHRDHRDVDPHVFAFDPDITGKVTEPSEYQGPQQMPTARHHDERTDVRRSTSC